MTKAALKWFVRIISSANDDAPLEVVFANGSRYKVGKGKPQATIIFKTRRAQLRTLMFDQVGFVEAYIAGEVELEGKDAINRLISMTYTADMGPGVLHRRVPAPLLKLRQVIYEARTNNKRREQAKINADSHYSMPSKLFELVLDEQYGYTEGYYPDGDETCDEAQRKKFEYIARKLDLKKGQKVVEVGAGWSGYMAIYMAEKYGVDVVNYGLVEAQNRIMRERVAAKHLQDRVSVVQKDHRDLEEEPEAYDRYVSIGVIEHAGKDCQEDWIKNIATCLKPGGVGVLSMLTYMHPQMVNLFITRHIFPGGNLPSLPRLLGWLEKYGLYAVDIESLRYHYRRALEDWYDNFKQRWPEIQASDPEKFTEAFRRTWEVYLIGSIEAFQNEHDTMDVFHIVFTKGRSSDLYPKTRDFMYK